jgi:hypothetical protein
MDLTSPLHSQSPQTFVAMEQLRLMELQLGKAQLTRNLDYRDRANKQLQGALTSHETIKHNLELSLKH